MIYDLRPGGQKSHTSLEVFASQGFKAFNDSSTWKDPKNDVLRFSTTPVVGDAVQPRLGDGEGKSKSIINLFKQFIPMKFERPTSNVDNFHLVLVGHCCTFGFVHF